VFPGPADSFDPYWIEVSTDSATGDNTMVYFTTLVQNLLLNLGESPFYANNGIPGYQDVVQQVYPDYYVTLVQNQFSPYFSSLIITRLPISQYNINPTYQVTAVAKAGAVLSATVAY
jgi:hypothetical protein